MESNNNESYRVFLSRQVTEYSYFSILARDKESAIKQAYDKLDNGHDPEGIELADDVEWGINDPDNDVERHDDPWARNPRSQNHMNTVTSYKGSELMLA